MLYFCLAYMKRVANLLFSFGILTILAGCFEKVEFPSTPNIEFLDVRFFDLAESARRDSLVISFRFEDGDGDLGLSADASADVNPPYHDLFVYLDSRDSVVTISNLNEMIPPFYSAPVSKSVIQVREPGEEPKTLSAYNIFGSLKERIDDELVLGEYSCANYDIVRIPAFINREQNGAFLLFSLDIENDTVAIVRNPRQFNIHVDILKKSPEGTFEETFLAAGAVENCGTGELDARFPIFGDGTGKEGVIHYNYSSNLLRLGFQDNTFKLSFFIYDRAGNKSNIAESFEFTLDKITQ